METAIRHSALLSAPSTTVMFAQANQLNLDAVFAPAPTPATVVRTASEMRRKRMAWRKPVPIYIPSPPATPPVSPQRPCSPIEGLIDDSPPPLPHDWRHVVDRALGYNEMWDSTTRAILSDGDYLSEPELATQNRLRTVPRIKRKPVAGRRHSISAESALVEIAKRNEVDMDMTALDRRLRDVRWTRGSSKFFTGIVSDTDAYEVPILGPVPPPLPKDRAKRASPDVPKRPPTPPIRRQERGSSPSVPSVQSPSLPLLLHRAKENMETTRMREAVFHSDVLMYPSLPNSPMAPGTPYSLSRPSSPFAKDRYLVRSMSPIPVYTPTAMMSVPSGPVPVAGPLHPKSASVVSESTSGTLRSLNTPEEPAFYTPFCGMSGCFLSARRRRDSGNRNKRKYRSDGDSTTWKSSDRPHVGSDSVYGTLEDDFLTPVALQSAQGLSKLSGTHKTTVPSATFILDDRFVFSKPERRPPTPRRGPLSTIWRSGSSQRNITR